MNLDYYIFTFYSTHLALRLEREAKSAAIPVRLVPVPRSISSSCGLAAKVAPEHYSSLYQLCQDKQVEFENIYRFGADRHEIVE